MTLKGNINVDGNPSFDVSGALLGNSSLKELVFHDYNCVIGSETFQAIPRMIRTNQDFETIDLLFSDTMTDRYELVRLIAQAAEGHASLNRLAICYKGHSSEDSINHAGTAEAIGTMLHNAPALRELSLSGCYMGSAGARHLADGLSSKKSVVDKLDLSSNQLGAEEAGIFAHVLLSNQNLKSLDLSYNKIGDAGALELAVALRQNSTLHLLNLMSNKISSVGAGALAYENLKSLDLSYNNIGDAGALELAVALRQNNTLELLDLISNGIHSDGASALADALVENDALKDLALRHNSIGDDGATSIAEMLSRNESIEKVCLGGFGEMGLKAFATRLSAMNGLKTLVGDPYTSGYTSEIGNSFVLALEQNTTLETFDFDAIHFDFEVMPQVQRLLDLNRGGRRLLSATGESVPPLNYWPRILARSSDNADVLFHFLREIPNVLVAKAGSRKRKCGDHDETTSTM
jgi:Ran GTPase-activating protein (RanGAP) involved in mRNA processing and transport